MGSKWQGTQSPVIELTTFGEAPKPRVPKPVMLRVVPLPVNMLKLGAVPPLGLRARIAFVTEAFFEPRWIPFDVFQSASGPALNFPAAS